MLKNKPKSYIAIEQNAQAVQIVKQYLQGENQDCKLANGQETGLESGSARGSAIIPIILGSATLTVESDVKEVTAGA